MKADAPRRAPSRELVQSTTAGAAIGGLIEVAATAAGCPLPPGSGAVIASAVTALAHWVQGRGRAPKRVA